MVVVPRRGSKINGSREVTGIGTASVTHQVIIQAASASTLPAVGEIKSSGMLNCNTIKRMGPKMNGMYRLAREIEFTNKLIVLGYAQN